MDHSFGSDTIMSYVESLTFSVRIESTLNLDKLDPNFFGVGPSPILSSDLAVTF